MIKKRMDGFETLQRLEQLLRDKLQIAKEKLAQEPPKEIKPEELPFGVSKVVSAMRRHDADRNKKKKGSTKTI